ncbi:MAG: AI-2E family transporter [Anaerolineales bacterium]|nr:AI-2E family transporter [Anaerolineales bacterium]
MAEQKPVSSPRWGAITKLVVALTFIAILAWVFSRFQSIIPPLLMAFILSYLLYPVAGLLNRKLRFSWRAAVGSIFVLLLILFLSLLTVGGLGLVQQIQSLIRLIQNSLVELPQLVTSIADWFQTRSPIPVDLNAFDLNALTDQLISVVQPLLGQTGQLLGTVASGAAQFFGWAAFILLVSFFVLSESGGFRGRIIKLNIPGYNEDLSRLGRELGRIWNAFLRGQIIIFFMTVIVYTIMLSVLGIRYAIGLAFLAGLARFLPYIGPAINWVILVLVAYFQPFKLFGMEPLAYTLLVVVLALIVDQIFDNLVSPRIMADVLKVHPAGVLVMALVAANLLGILGVVIAAPFLATLQLVGQYVLRKMFDQDPWPEAESETIAQSSKPLRALLNRILGLLRRKKQLSTPEADSPDSQKENQS